MFVKMKSERCKLSPQRASNQQNNTQKGANIDNILQKIKILIHNYIL